MRKVIALLLAAVMLLALTGCMKQAEKPDVKDAETIDKTDKEGSKTIKVTVVHGDGTAKEFTYDTDEEFLGPLLQEDGLVKGNAGPYGLEMTHVDGEKAVYTEDNAYWALYEGEEYAMQGIDTTPIVDGGEYTLAYTPA